ncbi:hypothetical protein ACFE04_002448 [Oxalis oulophora]
MFDWNDEELSNIIWGEAGESGDHIVPFRDENNGDYHRKQSEWCQQGSATVKHSEQRNPEAKGETHGRKPKGGSLNFDETTSTSWPQVSLSNNPAKNDQEDSHNLHHSSSVETAELDKGSENFQNALEDKEQVDFVDYSWDNIGSFDDLDRILSDDDPIFGHVSLDSTDELWPSSKDITNNNSPAKSFPVTGESASFESGPLRDTSQRLDTKIEYEPSDDPPFISNYDLQSGRNIPDQLEYRGGPGGKSKRTTKEKRDFVTGGKATALNSRPAVGKAGNPYQLTDKASVQKKPSKNRKKPEQKVETKLAQNFYTLYNPSGRYENQLSPAIVRNASSSVLSQQRQFQGSEALQYHHYQPGPFIAYPAYGNFANPYPMMPVIHPGEFKHPTMLSSYEAPPCTSDTNKSLDIPTKTLTPQEKIEKLRRRQQMRAMLAIKKQQQQFGHQASCSNKIQNVEDSVCGCEDLSGPFLDQNSPLEQDDSNTVTFASEDCSVYRLQDVISKLDDRIRISIRDSLFRLAQSAMQRNYETYKQEVAGQKELDSDNTEMPDAETETNPIDRVVAQLLFRRPTDKHTETLDGSKSEQKNSHRGPKNPYLSSEPEPELVDQFRNSPNVDISENTTSNYEPGDVHALEIEASQ